MIKLQFRDQPARFVGVTGASLTIGRDATNDLIIDDPSVSDFHAEVASDADGLAVADLLSATGTFVNDQRVGHRHPLRAWDVLRLGSVELEVNDPAVHRPHDWALRGQSELLAGQYLTIRPMTVVGRGGDCDLTIDDATLSRRHAELSIENGQLRVRDLGSANGTQVNGERITDHVLSHGDEVKFGSRVFVVVAPAESLQRTGPGDDITRVQGEPHNELDLKTELLTGQYPKASLTERSDFLGGNWRFDMRRSCRLGRSPDNDIVIPDSSVSRAHALLAVKGYRWQIEDLQSSNGVLINGERIESATLRNGDLITIGRAEFRFDSESG